MTAGELLREARRRHGLSQTRLARRAGTSQAAISRIERGLVSPTIETLAALVAQAGDELVLDAREFDWGHDRSLLQTNLALSPRERIANAASVGRAVSELRRAARSAA